MKHILFWGATIALLVLFAVTLEMPQYTKAVTVDGVTVGAGGDNCVIGVGPCGGGGGGGGGVPVPQSTITQFYHNGPSGLATWSKATTIYWEVQSVTGYEVRCTLSQNGTPLQTTTKNVTTGSITGAYTTGALTAATTYQLECVNIREDCTDDNNCSSSTK